MKNTILTTIATAAIVLAMSPGSFGASFANLNISGDINLVPSTVSDGNILKGSTRFIHNFGTDNTFVGLTAGNFYMTGGENTGVGKATLLYNSGGFLNTAVGYEALLSNVDGNSNTAVGAYSMAANGSGEANTATGSFALYQNTSGISNTGFGFNALKLNITGWFNTAMGSLALSNSSESTSNTAIGYKALWALLSGNDNTALGAETFSSMTSGYDNIALGKGAGSSLLIGSNNIDIGNNGMAGESDTIRIGTSSVHWNTYIAGIRGVTTSLADGIPVVIDSDGQLGTLSSSLRVKDDVADMGLASNVLMHLRPVTFHYKADHNPQGRSLQYGLVAEEVAAVAPDLVAHAANGEIETVYYQKLAPMLINEYQKQQHVIEKLTIELSKQTARVAVLELQAQQIAELKQQLARITPQLTQR